ncbi:M15 family metallopeptidase [Lyngbya confervoides]|uniref:D-alanyl-D-alanine dipeptidase n=1 Tax=Lyngbya confervoides BDU141951 TaxID=1574623 RepID=A0ABD4T5N6_9CYAN|nr:M15 family metallopeptidase [Lyngbya confervoides]MCM1983562.1 D-alanyl-D-alanine dipeptidase [Lyngbya confervoides BDU141951]
MSAQRPHWQVPIQECGEPLVEIPLEQFAHSVPHAYQALGAPYGSLSPYCLRLGVKEALIQAQKHLQQDYPHWQLYIFDAYRPLAVQAFMAHHAFQTLVQARGLAASSLTSSQTHDLWSEVYKIWAPPQENPLTPPPHSTGGAVDLTLFDTQTGQCVEMGSPIDELSERSQPDYFQQQLAQDSLSNRAQAQAAAQHRTLLAQVMQATGFKRHPGEWWHFCLGDQMWVWLSGDQGEPQARYGRYDLLIS